MTTFHLPDLGEGLQEAEIVAWHVAAGDHVVADQPLVSVETDKAVVEIPAPQSGDIAKLHGKPGDLVAVGAPLVEFADSGGARAVDAGTVVGELPRAEAPRREAVVEEGRTAKPARAGTAAPAVRALAGTLGVNLATLTGSGPGGAITSDDVRKAAGEGAQGGRVEKLRGVRRAMAQNMAKAGSQIVPATVMDYADIDHWPAGADPTIRLIRAICTACKAEPALNAWYDAEAGERRLHERVDLGLAMDTPDGLFVPVLRDVAARKDDDLRQGLEKMKADVRARSVPPRELMGQTITLSNFGMFGGRHVALVVLPPQVASLGAGRIEAQAVPVAGKIEVHRVLPLSLTFDHRVVTGGEAARFMAAVITALEEAHGA